MDSARSPNKFGASIAECPKTEHSGMSHSRTAFFIVIISIRRVIECRWTQRHFVRCLECAREPYTNTFLSSHCQWDRNEFLIVRMNPNALPSEMWRSKQKKIASSEITSARCQSKWNFSLFNVCRASNARQSCAMHCIVSCHSFSCSQFLNCSRAHRKTGCKIGVAENPTNVRLGVRRTCACVVIGLAVGAQSTLFVYLLVLFVFILFFSCAFFLSLSLYFSF